MNKNILIKNVDIKLLKLQNSAILRCIDDTKEKEEKDLLNGVLNLIETMIDQEIDVEYTEEDSETDFEWFAGLGVDEDEARDYIVSLLYKVEEVTK